MRTSLGLQMLVLLLELWLVGPPLRAQPATQSLWLAPQASTSPFVSEDSDPALREEAASQAFNSLKREYDAALINYHYLRPERKSERRRREAFEKYYPKPADWGPRFASVAERFPGTQAAALSLVWVVEHMGPVPLEAQCRKTLLKEHLARPCLSGICAALVRDERAGGRADLEYLFDHSPVDGVKASALRTLCQCDLELLRKQQDQALRNLVEQRIALLRDRFGSQVLDGKSGTEWANRFSLELRHLSLGQQFLDWQAQDLSGEHRSILDYQGKIVLVFFWKSTAAPCGKAIPRIVGLLNKWENTPLQVLGVSGDMDRGRAKRWKEALNVPFPNWQAPTSPSNSNIFGVDTWPSYFVLDESGCVLASDVSFEAAQVQVEAALLRLTKAKEREETQREEEDPETGETPEAEEGKRASPLEATSQAGESNQRADRWTANPCAARA